jgi:hypothetical protein
VISPSAGAEMSQRREKASIIDWWLNMGTSELGRRKLSIKNGWYRVFVSDVTRSG